MVRKRNTSLSHSHQEAPESHRLFAHSIALIGDFRWEEGTETLRQFIRQEQEPANLVDAYQNLSICYQELERYEQGLEALQSAEKLGADPADIAHQRSILYAFQGQAAQAIAEMETYQRLLPRQARQEKIGDKIKLLRSVQKGKASPDAYQVDHLLQEIGFIIKLNEFAEVERLAQRMVALAPENPQGHFYLGVACSYAGRKEQALAAYKQVLRLEPKHDITLHNLGYVLLELNRPQEALPYLENALRQNRKYVPVMHELGRAYEMLGRREEAIRLWQQALKLDRDYEPAQWRLHEVGAGPKPLEEHPPTAQQIKLRQMEPLVRASLRKPRVYKQGSIRLTIDRDGGGYMLEDSENSHNYSLYTGGPYETGRMPDAELLDLMGNIKMMLRLADESNTRDLAVLVYYRDSSKFSYLGQGKRGKSYDFDADGRFVVSEVPLFFKVRSDSDLQTAYFNPMQGMLVCLHDERDSAITVRTMGISFEHDMPRLWGR